MVGKWAVESLTQLSSCRGIMGDESKKVAEALMKENTGGGGGVIS